MLFSIFGMAIFKPAGMAPEIAREKKGSVKVTLWRVTIKKNQLESF